MLRLSETAKQIVKILYLAFLTPTGCCTEWSRRVAAAQSSQHRGFREARLRKLVALRRGRSGGARAPHSSAHSAGPQIEPINKAEDAPFKTCYLLICSSPDFGIRISYTRVLGYSPALADRGAVTLDSLYGEIRGSFAAKCAYPRTSVFSSSARSWI